MESSSIKFLFYVLVLVVQSMNWKSEGVMNWCIVEHMVIVAPLVRHTSSTIASTFRGNRITLWAFNFAIFRTQGGKVTHDGGAQKRESELIWTCN